jgi:CubicO group peptidase (beta-lactamase class C family)
MKAKLERSTFTSPYCLFVRCRSIACALLWTCDLGAQQTSIAKTIAAYIQPYVATNNFSGQVLVRRGSRVLYEKTFGQADRELKQPVTPATRFHVASVSMQLTAAAVMRLIDSHKLTLDTRVSDVIPSIRDGDRITIRNILQEQSGLSDINLRRDYAEILQRPQTPASLVAFISGDTLLFAPGTGYVHEEHSAFNVLALIIERKTGLQFLDAMERLLFAPGGMQHSAVDDDADSCTGNAARGYAPWARDNLFIGKWKLVPSKSRMPDEMKLQSKGGNTYAFDFGGDVETIVVDGSYQPGLGGTLLSVKAEAPDTWIVKRKKGSRLLLSATWKLSSDRRTLTDYYREFEADGSTQSIDYVYQRTGGGPGFVGDWQSIKETINSPFLLEVKEFQGDGLSFVDPLAQRTKNLKFDGKDYPASEVPNAGRGPSSSIRRVNERTLVITNKYEGKVSNTEEFSLSPDLKTLTMTVHIVGRDKPYVLTFKRN